MLVQPGDQVEFVVREDGVVELLARTRPLLSLAGVLGERQARLSIDEAIAAHAAERFEQETS